MAIATKQPSPTGQIDKHLLARLTGTLGDSDTIGRVCNDLANVLMDVLPDIFRNETDLNIRVGYDGFKSGSREELIASLEPYQIMAEGSLRGWSPDLFFSCGSPLVIAMVETLLGALPETIEEPAPRSLSKIELDVADMVITRIAGVVKSAVMAGSNFEPLISRPYNSESRTEPLAATPDVHSALMTMVIHLGKISSTFTLLVPHKALLKTTVTSPKIRLAGKSRKEWTDQLKQQVERSQVVVEARIKLQSLTLGTISRLQAGDVIPFLDLKDVKVGVNANGKELYVGEFGRSGSKYTVRVQDTFGTGDDLLQHLMS
ncbi:MAG: Flagellar motor switch protein FliM [Pseudomonadota bacterium]